MEGLTEGQELESTIASLEATGNFRVIRRFECPDRYSSADESQKLVGVFLDVETTGMDPETDDVIELAMVPFEFSSDGKVYRVLPAYVQLHEPGKPIDPLIEKLTGITNEMLKGKRIDPDEVRNFLQGVSILVAHNARFDRPFFEKTLPELQDFAWACSLQEVPWKDFGIESSKLEYLAYRAGVFYDGHRAEIDCQVGIHLLAQNWIGQEETPFMSLLKSARETKYRLWASGSLYEAKDLLKARGYRFDGSIKTWYLDLNREHIEAEKEWLSANAYPKSQSDVRLGLTAISAKSRYRQSIKPTHRISVR